jgi:5-methylcytosine-specific restriction enzyme subunit McrC
VGTRPDLPERTNLRRIRYSPIRYPFRAVVERSWRIAQQGGYTSSHEEGRAEGVLLDVAELWEHLVLNAVRRAASPDVSVEHGSDPLATQEHLFQSVMQPTQRMGRLKPDVTVRHQGQVIAIIDAKYKHLGNRADAPDGVERADRYQLASYLSALRSDTGVLGVLAYPAEADQSGDPLPKDGWRESRAEVFSPWTTGHEDRVTFRRFSLTLAACAHELQGILEA